MAGIKLTWTPNTDTGIESDYVIGTENTDRNKLLFTQLGGFSGSDTEDYTSKSAYQNGRTYFSQFATERQINFTFRINGDGYDDINIRKLDAINAFSATNGEGVLKISFPDGREYSIRCVPKGAPIFNDVAAGSKSATNCTIFLTAYDPFWFNPTENTLNIYVFTGGFTLPFTVPFTLGQSGQYAVINSGHASTPVTIQIPRPITNPIITNTRTGEHIEVVKTLLLGEFITIDTSFKNALVTYTDLNGNRYNILSAVTPESEFWQLLPGRNEITLSDVTALDENPLILSWYDKYWGVF